MTKRRNRLMATILATTLATGTFLSGCGQDSGSESGRQSEMSQNESAENSGTDSKAETSSEAGTDTEANVSDGACQTTYGDKQFDNVTITVEIFDRSNAPEGSTITDNKWTKYAQEEMGKVGINVEYVAVPRNDETTKIQTMMATGTSPDIIFTYDSGLIKEYFDDGGLYALNEYIDGEDQAKNLKEYVTEDVLDYGRNENGELYAVVARRSTVAMREFFIRKDWLDALGLSVPTTVEEFYAVLQAFKENYPDCVPFYSDQMSSVGVSVLAHSFLQSVADEKKYNIASSNFTHIDDGAVEYFRFINKLYNEQLIEPEYYTISDASSELDRLLVNGSVGIVEANVNYNVDPLRGSLLQTLKERDPDAEYVSFAPLQNVNDGKVYNPVYAPSGMYISIPKTAKNVEACITYLDWLSTTEGGFTLYHGMEGEHFEYADNVPVVIDMEYNASDKDWIRDDIFLVGNSGYYYTEKDFTLAMAQSYGEWADYVIDNYANAGTGTLRYAPVYSSQVRIDHSTELNLVSDEYVVKCITCAESEFDSLMEAYRNELKEAGAEKVWEDYNNHYNAAE